MDSFFEAITQVLCRTEIKIVTLLKRKELKKNLLGCSLRTYFRLDWF